MIHPPTGLVGLRKNDWRRVAEAELAADAVGEGILVDDRDDGADDEVPVVIERDGDDGLKVERVFRAVLGAECGVVVELKGHGDQIGDGIGELLGELLAAVLGGPVVEASVAEASVARGGGVGVEFEHAGVIGREGKGRSCTHRRLIGDRDAPGECEHARGDPAHASTAELMAELSVRVDARIDADSSSSSFPTDVSVNRLGHQSNRNARRGPAFQLRE